MMLASPLLPTPQPFSSQRGTSDDSLQYRPSRDIETFNSLLPPPIEFVEGSSSGVLAVAEGKYEPINCPPKTPRTERSEPSKLQPKQAPSPQNAAASSSSTPGASLYPSGIDTAWPNSCTRASGLYNSGNTCFLNSALQCLLHTPPLLRVVLAHKKDDANENSCRVSQGFCMVCSLKQVAVRAHSSKGAITPSPITNHLQSIAKHMRRGRQEDSHEFLRYAIDAMQRACLAGYPPKLDPKLAETTWVHKIFGGRLRSRVTCQNCDHNSDTFDRILDLSVDIQKSDSLKDALRKFIAVDYLKGADKYKCEKCKKHVNAQKRFSVQDAPVVLTIHLKRFSPLGRKISHHVDYEDNLPLQPYMSEGQFGPSYSLYGVICHAGGGPNSGHYYAFVKSKDGRWFEMNDETITPLHGSPVNKKTAYMLFYIQSKGQGLEAAINSTSAPSVSPHPARLISGMKKKNDKCVVETKGAEDIGVKVSQPFIGPIIPSPVALARSKPTVDPQAALIKSKIAAASAERALQSLTSYASDSDAESSGKSSDEKASKTKDNDAVMASPAPPSPATPSLVDSQTTPSNSQIPSTTPSSSMRGLRISPIPVDSFYGTSSGKKRKSSESDDSDDGSPVRRPNGIKGSPHPRSKSSIRPAVMSPFDRLNRMPQKHKYTSKHAKRRWGGGES